MNRQPLTEAERLETVALTRSDIELLLYKDLCLHLDEVDQFWDAACELAGGRQ